MAFLAGVWVLYPTPTAVIAGVVLSEVVAMGWWYARSPVNPFLLYEGMARSEVSYAMKLAFTSGLSKSAARTDVFMLGLLGGSKATAEYVVAYKFSLILASAGQNMLNTILRPRLGKLLGEGRTSRLQREYDQVRLASLGIALLIAAGYVVLGREVLGLFGAYEMAYPVLLILTARHVIGIGFGKSSAYLKMAGYAGWAMSTVALMLGLNVVLNGLLVPAYGTGGAAVATLTTGLLVGTFKVGLVYRLDDVPLYSVSLAAFVAASVGVLFLAAGGVLAPAAAAPALLLLLAGVLAWNWATLEPAVRRVVDRGREMVER
jgi:O-antigen/teichoic acid export membrane protein